MCKMLLVTSFVHTMMQAACSMLHLTSYKLHVASCKLQVHVTSCTLQVASYKCMSQVARCKLQVTSACHKLHVAS